MPALSGWQAQSIVIRTAAAKNTSIAWCRGIWLKNHFLILLLPGHFTELIERLYLEGQQTRGSLLFRFEHYPAGQPIPHGWGQISTPGRKGARR